MKSLNGKVAVVTGASMGIGKAVAERLAGAGASVVITYAQSADKAQEVVTVLLVGTKVSGPLVSRKSAWAWGRIVDMSRHIVTFLSTFFLPEKEGRVRATAIYPVGETRL